MKRLFFKRAQRLWKNAWWTQAFILVGAYHDAHGGISPVITEVVSMVCKSDPPEPIQLIKPRCRLRVHFKKGLDHGEDLLTPRYYDKKGKLIPIIPQEPSIISSLVDKLGTKSYSIGVCEDETAVTRPAAKESTPENHRETLKKLNRDCAMRGSALMSSFIP